jgi:hypothetical protein
MRWNAVVHRKRPPASNRGARRAWDYFSKPNWNDNTKTFEPETRTPMEMSYRFMDYWVWVMKYTDDSYDEIDGLVIASNSRTEE